MIRISQSQPTTEHRTARQDQQPHGVLGMQEPVKQPE